MKRLEALLDAVGVYHPVAPFDTSLEPPGLTATVALLQFADVGQAPISEFGDHHGLTAAPANFGGRLPRDRVPRIPDVFPPRLDAFVHVGKGPRGPAGKGLDPLLPLPV